MRRGLALVTAAALLMGCTPQAPDAAGPLRWSDTNWLRPAMPGTACRVPGADGRILIAERGIGGTGPITRPPPAPNPAGTPPPTGVAAVITGFGSVCLAGLEVELAPSLAVTVDGAAAGAGHLAAGERAVLIATWKDRRPTTAKIAIRHEIVGPLERVLGPDHLVVAGQDVRIAPGAWVQAGLSLGDWVAVSGLPQPNGGVLASRIDPAPAGEALLRGRLHTSDHGFAVGALPVAGPGVAALAGQMVDLRGRLAEGHLEVATARLDQLQTDPAIVFGPAIRHYAIQALISGPGGGAAPFAAPVALPPGMTLPSVPEPAILGLVAVGATGLVATSVSVAGAAPGEPSGMVGPRGDMAGQPPARVGPHGPGGLRRGMGGQLGALRSGLGGLAGHGRGIGGEGGASAP